MVDGQQYNLSFIVVSYFHFEMFGVMADIFLLASFFLLVFAICVFSLCIFFGQPILAVFKFEFSNEIVTLSLYRQFFIKVSVLQRWVVLFRFQ